MITAVVWCHIKPLLPWLQQLCETYIIHTGGRSEVAGVTKQAGQISAVSQAIVHSHCPAHRETPW